MSEPNWRCGLSVPPAPRSIPLDDEEYTSEECLDDLHVKCGDDGVCVCHCHAPDDPYGGNTYVKYFWPDGTPRSAW